jgi:hypothetical protein
MSYRGLKIFIIALITGVLVHYSVAWAVLECFHTEDENVTETAVSIAGPYHAFVTPNHLKTNIQCIGSEYRIEPLASASVPNQPSGAPGNISSHVNGLSVLYDGMETAKADLWLFALFKRVSTLTFPISSPRYLSLSVLRI